MPDLLVEIFSEEIPSHLQQLLSEQLKTRFLAELQEIKLPYGQARSYSSPQRLVIVIEDIPWQTSQQKVESRGPRVGSPEKAVNGFLRSKNKRFEDLEVRTVGKGEYYFVTDDIPGSEVSDILKQTIHSALTRMSLPKSMYWGDGRTKWVRPIQALLGIIFDAEKTETVPFEFAGLTAGNITYGHRFMAPDEIAVKTFDDYRSKLQNSFVVIDPKERMERIQNAILSELAEQYSNLELVRDDDLLVEIAGLVEWPVPLVGTIDATFQDLPEEVLMTTIKIHQKYLSVRDTTTGKISNFIAVANFQAIDGGKAIINGNQRVLASRLSDAQFFLNEDLNRFPDDLLDLTENLGDVRYSFGLGTQKDRVGRIEVLARRIATDLACNPRQASTAAQLAKIDLVTLMVREFPELQGVMGRYYGSKKGLDPEICQAIAEHYLPTKPSDSVPSNPLSITIGLADRINHLAGFFLRKEVPSGLGDPNALRRAALGIIRLILDNRITCFYLRDIISIAIDQHFGLGSSNLELKASLAEKEEVREGILTFILRRLAIYLVARGHDAELVEACINVPANDDIFEIVQRIEALEAFLATDSGKDLLHLDKRIAKISSALQGEGDEDNSLATRTRPIDSTLFDSSYEEALYEKYQDTLTRLSGQENVDYLTPLQVVASLRNTIDDYFDHVMINAEDPLTKTNRLNLLANIRKILAKDFNLRLISDQKYNAGKPLP